MKKKIIVIGAGFAGLSAATCLANQGFSVKIIEKKSIPGGRAHLLKENGFTFDMGPSWYWMPDVFEKYFNKFGKSTTDYYKLTRLDPGYRVVFDENKFVDVPAKQNDLYNLFERIEPGSSANLRKFLNEAAYKYEVGINDLVYKPGRSISELLDIRLAMGVLRLQVFQSIAKHIRKYFKNPILIQLLEFPVLFLGATPQNTPALYSLMNYADLVLGTWYPMGGMYEVVKGMVALAQEKGVEIITNSPVKQLVVENNKVTHVITDTNTYQANVVVASADYHHVEQQLLPKKYRVYSSQYWEKRTLAPSSLLFYLGLNKKLDHMKHHTLFFDQDFAQHANEIYETPKWPSKPLFYTSCTSITDPSTAPKNHENLVVLIPVAPNLQDDEEQREKYYNMVIHRMEKLTNQQIGKHVIFKKSYAHKEFIKDYNSFKGNAYGLANTLKQTALLRPSVKNKKLSNLYYSGQLTVPGPGVPPSIISGQVVAKEVVKEHL